MIGRIFLSHLRGRPSVSWGRFHTWCQHSKSLWHCHCLSFRRHTLLLWRNTRLEQRVQSSRAQTPARWIWRMLPKKRRSCSWGSSWATFTVFTTRSTWARCQQSYQTLSNAGGVSQSSSSSTVNFGRSVESRYSLCVFSSLLSSQDMR